MDIVLKLAGDEDEYETFDAGLDSLDAILKFLRDRCGRFPGWVRIGHVVCFSAQIVSITPANEEDYRS